MKWIPRLMLGAALSTAHAAAATTVFVTITGSEQTAYELDVGGIRKTGRITGTPGVATVRDIVDIEGRRGISATLIFKTDAGILATCPEVKVPLRGAQTLCEPAFVLTGEKTGVPGPRCQSRCDPRRRVEKSDHEDEEEEEDRVYAIRQPRKYTLAPK